MSILEKYSTKLKLLLEALSTMIVSLAFIFIIILYFSNTEKRFECAGAISSSENAQSVTVFIKQKQFRWWVGLWNDSDGSIWLEYPTKTVENYEQSKNSYSDLIVLLDSNKMVKGTFSSLSHSLNVEIPSFGTFTGLCKDIQ